MFKALILGMLCLMFFTKNGYTESFQPGSEDIYLLNYYLDSKKVNDGCKDPWDSPGALLSRIGAARRGKYNRYSDDTEIVVKMKNSTCIGYHFKNEPKTVNRYDCKDSIESENKNQIVLNPNKPEDIKKRQVIFSSKDACINFLRNHLTNLGYQISR